MDADDDDGGRPNNSTSQNRPCLLIIIRDGPGHSFIRKWGEGLLRELGEPPSSQLISHLTHGMGLVLPL